MGHAKERHCFLEKKALLVTHPKPTEFTFVHVPERSTMLLCEIARREKREARSQKRSKRREERCEKRGEE